jgi:hypothetical protein
MGELPQKPEIGRSPEMKLLATFPTTGSVLLPCFVIVDTITLL